MNNTMLGVCIRGNNLTKCKDAIVERAVQRLRDNCEQYGIDFDISNVHLVIGVMGIETCISDALSRFDNPKGSEVDVYSFPQTWSSTSLGFGGIGGQMISKAQTIVVISEWTFEACVYFCGKFAYIIRRPNNKLYDCLCVHEMPSVRDYIRLER